MLDPTNWTTIPFWLRVWTRSWVWKFDERVAVCVTCLPFSTCVQLMLASEILTVLPWGIWLASSACWNWPNEGALELVRNHCWNATNRIRRAAIRIHGDTRGLGTPGPVGLFRREP